MDAGAVVLWPEEEDLYTLMCIRTESGRTAFEREKQNSPINPDLCEWPESYFDETIWFDTWPKNLRIKTMALDPSKGADARRGDYSALVMLGVSRQGVLYLDADMARRPTPQIVADGVATIAASFTSKFQNPKKTPFSFFVSPSYGTMGRIALKWIRDNWKDKSRNPKICYLYPDNKYGRDILAVCKDYAKKIGVDVGPDQVINWPTKDATVQLTNMKRYDPDFAYITSE